jgi:hypothetical protein
MDKRQESIVKMGRTVSGVFVAYQTTVDKTPSLPANQDKLDNLIEESEKYSREQLSTGTEFTDKKNVAKRALAAGTIKICSALAGYGASSTDTSVQFLKNLYVLTDSEIKTKRDMPLFAFAYKVYNDALPYADKLAPFATKADVDNLKVLADNFNLLLPKRRTQQGTAVLATKNLEEVITGIMAVLDDPIEILVKALQATEPDFFNAFTHARHIVEAASGKKKSDGGTTGTAGTGK